MKNKILDTETLQGPTLKEKFQECIKKEIDVRQMTSRKGQKEFML